MLTFRHKWLASLLKRFRADRHRATHRRRFRPRVEALEDRRLLAAPIVVRNVNDTGEDSLRWAINKANMDAGPDIIEFNIVPGGPKVIVPNSFLPTISQEVIIDGTTQPGFAGTPLIRLDGANAGANDFGLSATGLAKATIRGLIITNWGGAGIHLSTGDTQGTKIEFNLIGIRDDNVAQANRIGVLISGGAGGNTIGGTTFTAGNKKVYEARNVISGNTEAGIRITHGSKNKIFNNYIGTNRDGTMPVGNGNSGIEIISASTATAASGNRIGVLALTDPPDPPEYNTARYNVISGNGTASTGNSLYGVYINGKGATGNKVSGNFIGTDRTGENVGTGTAKMGNYRGVVIRGEAKDNEIGQEVITDASGIIMEPANVISGNTYTGVAIWDKGSTNNKVMGSFIGTHRNGVQGVGNDGNPMGNGGVGIHVSEAPANKIGGLTDGKANVISGNVSHGVWIDGAGATDNEILRNIIGVNKNKNKVKILSLVNGSDGIYLGAGADKRLSKKLAFVQ